MNYHYIKNNYEIVEYSYQDVFDIQIYYLNENYFIMNVKRIDSSDGWGLELKIKLFDLFDNEKYEIIIFGNSKNNFNSKSIYTNILLQWNEDIKVKIPYILKPRNEYLIKNKYNIIQKEKININFHIVIYYLEEYKIKIIVRRLDNIMQWENNLKLYLYDDELNMKDIITIGSSIQNYKILFVNTNIKINYFENDYKQNIQKNILQTGINNEFKDILHFNSVISFIELNPEYTYIFYDHDEGKNFLKENFNESINNSFNEKLLSYCMLFNNGGFYFNYDMILKISFRHIINFNKNIFFCNEENEKTIFPKIIISNKKNIIIEKMIKDNVQNNVIENNTSFKKLVSDNIIFKKNDNKIILLLDNSIIVTY